MNALLLRRVVFLSESVVASTTDSCEMVLLEVEKLLYFSVNVAG